MRRFRALLTESTVMLLPTQKAGTPACSAGNTNPWLAPGFREAHSTSHQSGVRQHPHYWQKSFSMRTRHSSNIIPFCYSGSDSKEYTKGERKALVLCDEAKGPRGLAYMHLKQTLLVICNLLRVFQMVCEDQCSACSKSLGSFKPSHPN